MVYREKQYNDTLCHFNQNHDPETGRFTSSTHQLGFKNLRKSKTANIDKWGKSPEANVLYMTGYSGSGKSTAALSLANRNDQTIHLDGYTELHAETAQNKIFNAYLDKHVPDWKKMVNATKDGSGIAKRYSPEYWKVVDEFRLAIESFGKEQYNAGNKVIVEGVQISDDWLAADKSYYADKPLVILTTNPITSMHRAFDRDGRGNLIQGLINLDSAKEYIQWYYNSNKRLSELSKIAGAEKGQTAMSDLLKKYGNLKV